MIIDAPRRRDRTRVFRDRSDAGSALAQLLSREPRDALVLAIPSGGVPVAVALCKATGRPLDIAIVSKITLPWNSEAGYGAVAFDGSCRLNEALLPHLGLTRAQIDEGIEATRAKVERRTRILRGDVPALALEGRAVILVDDGLASGLTVQVAIEALRHAGVRRIAVAVPTAHAEAAERIAPMVDAFYCANLRGGQSFSVADAYTQWRDVPEVESARLLQESRTRRVVN